MSFEQQLNRIKEKLEAAKRADKECKVFSSKDHQYNWNKPITKDELADFEKLNHVSLPSEFSLFLTELGNGGAGPYYGIYPIKSNKHYPYLSSPVKAHLSLPIDEWDNLIASHEEEEFFDTLYQGMLPIGTQGCAYEMMLIVTGEQRGRVVYINWDHYKPFITFEDHFLDWYERWLDEIILGYEIDWFGMNMSGDENELMQKFHQGRDEHWRTQAIYSMGKLPEISSDTILFLEEQCQHPAKEIQKAALQMLTKYSYDTAKPFLKVFLESENESDQLSSLKYIHWYAGENKKDWIEQIKVLLDTSSSPDNRRFINYIFDKVIST